MAQITTTSAPKIEGKADMSISAKIKKTDIPTIYNKLVNAATKLKLEKKEHGTRLSFLKAGGRIVALEKGKRQVTMHLPKNVGDVETKLVISFDKRGFGYTRIKSTKEVPAAISLLKALSKLSK